MTREIKSSSGGHLFYGWWIVAAVFYVYFAGLCSGFYTVSVFLEPLQETFGWTRTQISLGFTIAALLVGLLSPLVGLAVSKAGTKNVLIFGSVFVAASLLLLGSVERLWQYYSLYVALAVGIACVGHVPNQTIISHWFENKRGTAMGIIMAGIGLGGMVMIYLASLAVDAFQWRWSYRLLGAFVLCTVLPVILFVIKNRPSEMGLTPDGAPASGPAGKASSSGISFTLKESLGSLTFYLLCFMMAFYSVIVGAMTQHAIALLRSGGITDPSLFWSATLGASVVGRLLFGSLADRVSKKGLIVIIWALHIAGLAALYYIADAGSFLWLFVVSYGLALGGFATVFPVFLGERFGVEHFSKLVGITGLFMIIGMAAGSILLGTIYDKTESYGLAVQILIGVAVVSLVLSTIVGRPRKISAS
jgi:MFS family permease